MASEPNPIYDAAGCDVGDPARRFGKIGYDAVSAPWLG
jgi:hypothetical protein